MAIANVALTNTFDQWRITTNQLVAVVNDIEFTSNLVKAQSNTTPLVVTSAVSRGGTLYFELSTNSSVTNVSTNVLATSNVVNTVYVTLVESVNAVNSYANAVGIAGNAYANVIGTAGNAYTDLAVTSNLNVALTYANSVSISANAYALSVAGGGSDVANAYSRVFANTVGDSSNAYSRVFANTVGDAANNFAGTMANSSNSIAIAAFDKANNSTTAVIDEISSASSYYIIFTANTSGPAPLNVSSSKLTFIPSTGTLSSTEFNSLSDLTLKTDIKQITNALEIISNIDGVSFRWKDSGKPSFGVIAQQIEEYIPALADTVNDHKTVNYDGIIAFLIEAIKELNAKLESK